MPALEVSLASCTVNLCTVAQGAFTPTLFGPYFQAKKLAFDPARKSVRQPVTEKVKQYATFLESEKEMRYEEAK